jgi:hypothetical protein
MIRPAGKSALTVLGAGALFVILHLALDPRPRAAGADERAAVLDALGSFNAIWADFYATGGIPSMIDDFPAAKMVKHGIFRDTGWLESMDRVQVYDLARLEPLEVRFHPDGSAEADVYEEWNYVIQEKSTRRPLTEVKGMGQGFRYRFQREGSRWIVTAWEPLDVPAPARSGEFHF